MSAIDFANSYMTFFGHDNGSIARIQLDAACTIVDDRSAASETFYLIAPCRSEEMYGERDLFKTPNYDFRGVWSHEECLILRKHWVSEPEHIKRPDQQGTDASKLAEYSLNRERFAEVRLDIRTFKKIRSLSDPAEIVELTLSNVPLVARTKLRAAHDGVRALLEYPVKTMNILRDPPSFQVDTGPLIVPDFNSRAEHYIQRFDVAYVAYNVFDKTEFILRKPTRVMEGDSLVLSVTDYSEVREAPAVNEIIAAG
jgi:hypothetical protein